MIERHIEREMVDYIEEKLSGNGLYIAAVRNQDFRALVCLAAQACVGIHELTGHNDGRMVQLIQETVGNASGEPYCAAGVMTCIAFAELKTGLFSPIPATELARDIWLLTPIEKRATSIPLAGAIAIWSDLDRSGKQKRTGHCEIVLDCDGRSFHAIGFNTSGTVKPGEIVNREGNGVYYTLRSMKSTSLRKLLGFVKPI